MRPTKERHYLDMAALIAKRGTCLRRQVGCVLVDVEGRVLSTGYNGKPRGMRHCNQVDSFDPLGYPYACVGANSRSGEDLHLCEAVHAEQNAMLQCPDVDRIYAAYVTTSPCLHCIKMLMNTGCKRVYAPEIYDQKAIDLWVSYGREFTLYV